jgi:hypothetical protein
MRWAVPLVASASMGCFSHHSCEGVEPCEPPPEVVTCEGVCAPFVGAGWSPVLVASSSPRARCPAVAPVEAMATSSLTACGVPEGDGDCNDGLVCLESEPGWTACIVRDGAHACPTFYEAQVQAEDGVTLCCPAEDPPA